jgi:hypothetical protein
MSEYRSFRLFKYSPPEKTVADYSDAEKEQFQAAFKPIAKRYRLFSYIILAICIGSFLLLAVSSREDWWWLFCSVILFGIGYSILCGPVCPACKRKVDDGVKTFCPECGSKVSPGKLFKAPFCLSCGKRLLGGKRRSYEICCCTHCGIFLDGKGI